MDVPSSISAAQGTAEKPCFDTLLSSEPLAFPFPSNEPRSAAARAKLRDNTIEETHHAEYSITLHRALEQVRQKHQGPWCLPRASAAPTRPPSKKRKLEEEDSSPKLPAEEPFQANNSGDIVNFHVPAVQEDGEVNRSYRVPPYSSFSLSDCSSSTSFLSSVRNQAQDASTRRHFDMILLDPPWPNRSVKRSHKTPGRSYQVTSTLDEVFQLIIGTDLDMLMAENCLIGIWITNKRAVRELVCGQDGIFAVWGVVLEEEWIWLKTTEQGEPVSGIDSLWRKPYEILLLGRKRPSTSFPLAEGVVKRRTIVSVPDLHSRKPCLKSLLEPMMPNPQNYRALEVFARHLISGWWSWGNECIKFNWSGYWRPQRDALSDRS